MRRGIRRKLFSAGWVFGTTAALSYGTLFAADAGSGVRLSSEKLTVRTASHNSSAYPQCPPGYAPVGPGTLTPNYSPYQGGMPAAPGSQSQGSVPSGQSSTGQSPDAQSQPGTAPQDVTQQQAPDLGTDSLSSATGGAESASSGAPNMIGDFFTPPSQSGSYFSTVVNGRDFLRDPSLTPTVYTSSISGSPAGFVRYTSSTPLSALGVPVTGTYVVSGTPVSGTDFYAPSGLPSSLVENTAFTQAVLQGSGASSVVFNEGEAVSIGGSSFNILQDYDLIYGSPVFVPSTGGLVVGRSKVSDNNSPLPRCRVFLDYNYFDNVPLTAGGVNVKRFTPGFEKAFSDGRMSIEVRAPMAITLGSNAYANGASDLEHAEFGDMTFVTKALLYQGCTAAVSCGAGITVPTADDFRVKLTNGATVLDIEHRAVHVVPYIAVLQNSGGKFYTQAFGLVDVDTNGDDVSLNIFDGMGLRRAGTLQDQTLLHIDWSLGYWAYQNSCACSGLSGIALTTEVHYSTNLNDADGVSRGDMAVGGGSNDFDLVNLTFGAHLMQACGSVFTFGYGVPVSNDRFMDGELRVLMNQYF